MKLRWLPLDIKFNEQWRWHIEYVISYDVWKIIIAALIQKWGGEPTQRNTIKYLFAFFLFIDHQRYVDPHTPAASMWNIQNYEWEKLNIFQG